MDCKPLHAHLKAQINHVLTGFVSNWAIPISIAESQCSSSTLPSGHECYPIHLSPFFGRNPIHEFTNPKWPPWPKRTTRQLLRRLPGMRSPSPLLRKRHLRRPCPSLHSALHSRRTSPATGEIQRVESVEIINHMMDNKQFYS